MTYAFTFGFLVTRANGLRLPADRLEQLTDELMTDMVDRETDAVFDPGVGATLTTAEVDIDLTVKARDEVAAAATARDFVIESIRAIGGTPIGLFVFPHSSTESPREEWHERKAELVVA